MAVWWLSTERMTGQVEIDAAGRIVGGAPIFRRFRGQPMIKLIKWLEKQGGLQKQRLDKDPHKSW